MMTSPSDIGDLTLKQLLQAYQSGKIQPNSAPSAVSKSSLSQGNRFNELINSPKNKLSELQDPAQESSDKNNLVEIFDDLIDLIDTDQNDQD